VVKHRLVIVLNRITDVRNFGAIGTNGGMCRAHAILIPSKGAAQINSDAVKTSAGALNIIPVCRVTNLLDAVRFLKQSGIAGNRCDGKDQRLTTTK